MFQLQNITIQRHPIFGNADINFINGIDEQIVDTGIATSVIIGRNGIGKSHLFRAIADIFRTHSNEHPEICRIGFYL